jgi:hypothetical protein
MALESQELAFAFAFAPLWQSSNNQTSFKIGNIH